MEVEIDRESRKQKERRKNFFFLFLTLINNLTNLSLLGYVAQQRRNKRTKNKRENKKNIDRMLIGVFSLLFISVCVCVVVSVKPPLVSNVSSFSPGEGCILIRCEMT